MTRLDRLGFQVHLHALGDRAVREALDAIEAARAANGPSDGRHHLAHLQVVDPADYPRFRELGVGANIQPYWACSDAQMIELTLPFLPADRRDLQYPFRSLQAAGARLVGGSDWSVSTPNVMAEIEVAVNRISPERRDAPPFLPDQALDLMTALAAFTNGSAWVEPPGSRDRLDRAGQAGRPGRPRPRHQPGRRAHDRRHAGAADADRRRPGPRGSRARGGLTRSALPPPPPASLPRGQIEAPASASPIRLSAASSSRASSDGSSSHDRWPPRSIEIAAPIRLAMTPAAEGDVEGVDERAEVDPGGAGLGAREDRDQDLGVHGAGHQPDGQRDADARSRCW